MSLNYESDIANAMYNFSVELFPICRSISGEGVRSTLLKIQRELPGLKIHEIKTGTTCFDWVIPEEWNINDAYISNINGERLVDFKDNNLHIVSYSIPFEGIVTAEKLRQHLHYREDMPEAIPYVTSYYSRNWGFCVSYNFFKKLCDPYYHVKIDTKIASGSMSYADLVIREVTEKEIIISTYICHPSMANNEISGIVVSTQLAKFVASIPNRYFTYRFVFLPETIGAIAYLSMHLQYLKENTLAGFVITCVGDGRCYSYLPSRKGNTLTDKVIKHVFERILRVPYRQYSFLERGSDERQYCAPGIDLPFASAMCSKYGTYPEYHTSLDDLNLISPQGLYSGYLANRLCIEVLEANDKVFSTTLGEPFLSRHGLRPSTINGVDLPEWSRTISQILAFSDGELDLIDMANLFNKSVLDLIPIVNLLKEKELLSSSK